MGDAALGGALPAAAAAAATVYAAAPPLIGPLGARGMRVPDMQSPAAPWSPGPAV